MNIFRHATVVGAFADEVEAEKAVAELHRAGFNSQQIGLTVHGAGRGTGADDSIELYSKKWDITLAVATFGLMAAMLGYAVVWCVSGIWPISRGDYFMAALFGAVAGGFAGGIFGNWTTMDISKKEAEYLESQIKAGHVIVTVRAGTRWSEAGDILRLGRAYHIGTSPRIRTVPRVIRAIDYWFGKRRRIGGRQHGHQR